MIDFKKLAENYKKDALNSLLEFLSINSVYDENSKDEENPYGKGVSCALNYLKNLAIKYGLKAEVYNNRVCEICFGETGNDIGIFAHSDVVPASGNWTTPPFEPNIRDNRIYARGTSDDKGPLMAALFSLILLKENNLVNNYKVRFVAGGDEERGSSCLEYYFHKLKKPNVDYGFTPDADFPLIYGEKGVVNYTLRGRIELDYLKSLKAGVAANCVIDLAKVEVNYKFDEFVKYLKENKINFTLDGETINFLGKSAHGSTPELGVNSGLIALKCLGEFYNDKILLLLAKQYSDVNGKELKQYYKTDKLGETTYNVGLINYLDNIFEMTVNFRFPDNVNCEHVINEIQKNSPFAIYNERESNYLYYDPNSPMIKTLVDVYQKETGDYKSKPFTIGGGTYAKEAKNTVAFGSHFPGKEDHIHEVDEKIDLEDFYNSISIYAHAIYALGNLKNK